MYVYHYKDSKNNFGDDLNLWLWEELAPGLFNGQKDSWMSGIGSIIDHNMPPGKMKIIFSSGAGYEVLPADIGAKGWHIESVRGPLSAEIIGHPQVTYVTDGAILLALLDEYQPVPPEERKGIVFMPHHGSLDYSNWQDVCASAGIEFISPREESKDILNKMRGAKLVLADAMHAAIVADTLRIPWIPISATPGTNGFKWLDWALSMNVPYKPVDVPASSIIESIEVYVAKLFGGLYAKGSSKEEALEHFRGKFIQKNSHVLWLERKTRRLIAKSLRRVCSFLKNTGFYKQKNLTLVEKAAERLQSVSKMKGYLSEDAVFESRKVDMQKRFEHVQTVIKGNPDAL